MSLAACGLVLAVSSPARADAEAEAKNLFARGRELRLEQNDCGTAAPLFRKAWTIYPAGLGSLRNLAECEEQLGHFASSRRAWLDLKRALITAPPDAKYDGWDKDAEEAATRLKPKVASFVVDVYIKSPDGEALANDRSGVDIFVNGESVGPTLVGTPLERDPGSYKIRAVHPDAQPVEQTVTLSAGDNPHITIRLTVTPKPQVIVQDHSTRRTVGFVVAGVGAATMIAGGITAILRSSAISDLEDGCEADFKNCKPDLKDTADRGESMTTATNLLLPIGGILLMAGGLLILTSRSTKMADPARTGMWITPNGVGGRFH